MLMQFNFQNYKSYFYETSLNMEATKSSEIMENVIPVDKSNGYLKTAAIFGANASGKSGVIDAFKFMKYWVSKSFSEASETEIIPVKRFNFSEAGRKDSALFEVFFLKENIEYQYGFKITDKLVLDEWLYSRENKPRAKFKRVFEREKQQYKLGAKLKKAEKLLTSINERTLLLSILSNLNLDEVSDVAEWFKETQVVDFGDTAFELLSEKAFVGKFLSNESSEYKKFIRFLTAIDTGITGIRVEEVPPRFDEDKTKQFKIFTKHKNVDGGDDIEIPLTQESSGTRKMINLYKFIIKSLEIGGVVFVDELDAKLHPLLTRYIVNLYQDEDINTKGAQLIFASHNSYLLNRELLRRDQIWFAEKDKNGISNLGSLVEFMIDDNRVRKDASYDKDYLNGRYDAIPHLKEFEGGDL